jgi:hypothetical protein
MADNQVQVQVSAECPRHGSRLTMRGEIPVDQLPHLNIISNTRPIIYRFAPEAADLSGLCAVDRGTFSRGSSMTRREQPPLGSSEFSQ